MLPVDTVAVGDDVVDGDVEFVGLEVVDELEVVAYTDCSGTRAAKQTVVIALSAAHTVAVAVVGNGRYYHEVNVVYSDCIVAVGLLDTEGPEVHARALVGQNLEVNAVDAGEVVSLVLG